MSDRSFPPNNGSVAGQPAYVEQNGDRTVGYYGQDNMGKIVSNDGLNASYVREPNGQVIVDDAQRQPYEPYQYRSN